MITSDLWDYKDVYILFSGTRTVTGERDDDNAKRTDERVVTFKH